MDQIAHDQQIQFTRIAQLQADLDIVRGVWSQLTSAPDVPYAGPERGSGNHARRADESPAASVRNETAPSRSSDYSLDMAEDEPTDAEILREQARALQKLIKEAQRIHTEISTHLSKIRHAGHPSDPNKKG